jgi:hypothetical protein
MDALKASVGCIKIDTTLIRLLQIVANMQESCASESVTKMSFLAVCCDESSEPIIGKANSWDLASVAAVLQACLAEDGDHFSCENGSIIRVWAREYVRVM